MTSFFSVVSKTFRSVTEKKQPPAPHPRAKGPSVFENVIGLKLNGFIGFRKFRRSPAKPCVSHHSVNSSCQTVHLLKNGSPNWSLSAKSWKQFLLAKT